MPTPVPMFCRSAYGAAGHARARSEEVRSACAVTATRRSARTSGARLIDLSLLQDSNHDTAECGRWAHGSCIVPPHGTLHWKTRARFLRIAPDHGRGDVRDAWNAEA